MLLDLGTHQVIRVPAAAGTFEQGRPAFSPDGAWIAYERLLSSGRAQAVIARVDRSGEPVALGPIVGAQPDGSWPEMASVFTPDGTSLVVRFGSDDSSVTWVLPVDGSPGRELTSGRFSFVDIQRLAP
jgi:Tol biopolymer transport system component